MGTSRKFKYAYVVDQHSLVGNSRAEMFGTDKKLTNNELEVMRRNLNHEAHYWIKELALAENDGHRIIIRSSKHSSLPKAPLFQVVPNGAKFEGYDAEGLARYTGVSL